LLPSLSAAAHVSSILDEELSCDSGQHTALIFVVDGGAFHPGALKVDVCEDAACEAYFP
jgi:hypothetical protein